MRPKMRPRMLVTRFYFLRKLFLFLIVLTFSHLYYDHMWSMKCKRHLKITHPAQYRICTLPSFPPVGLIRPRMLVTRFYFLRKLFLFLIVLTFSHLYFDHMWSMKCKRHLKITFPAQYRICTLPSFPPVGLIRRRMRGTHFFFEKIILVSDCFDLLIPLLWSYVKHEIQKPSKNNTSSSI